MTLQCLFCDQGNPDGAKFCNECGTPLHFKPCPQCDGINGRFADACYRCGAAFSPLVRDEEAPATLSSQPDGARPLASLAGAWDGFANDAAPAANAADSDASEASTERPAPLPAVPARMPWIPMTAAVVAACAVLGAVAWQTERAVSNQTSATMAAAPSAPAAPASSPRDGGRTMLPQPPQQPLAVATAPEPATTRDVTPSAPAARASSAKATGTQRVARTTVARSANAKSNARTQQVAARPPARSTKAAPPSRAPAPVKEAVTPPASREPPTARPPPAPVMLAGARNLGTPTRASDAPVRTTAGDSSYACREGAPATGGCDVRLVTKGN